MNTERFLSHYHRIADAPDAITRLRHFIFNLAVRGKLVLQDPTEEQISKLLKRITEEATRLGKAGKIRSRRPSSPIRDEECPIVLPNNWAWLRLNEIGNL